MDFTLNGAAVSANVHTSQHLLDVPGVHPFQRDVADRRPDVHPHMHLVRAVGARPPGPALGSIATG